MSRSRPNPNSHVCCVFTLLSIYLLSRGVTLTSSSHSQDCVWRSKLRQSLAFLLLQANELEATASITNHMPHQRRTGTASARSRAKRNRGKESRITLGSKKARTTMPSGSSCQQSSQKLITNRKRSAKTLSEPLQSHLTLEQAFNKPSKKAQKRRKKIIICYL